jgi:hypothetical protein
MSNLRRVTLVINEDKVRVCFSAGHIVSENEVAICFIAGFLLTNINNIERELMARWDFEPVQLRAYHKRRQCHCLLQSEPPADIYQRYEMNERREFRTSGTGARLS